MRESLLGNLSHIQTGPFGSQLHKEDYVMDGTPIVTVEHLGNRCFSTQNLPCVTAKDKARLIKYVLKEGDIVFSRVGSVDRCSYVDTEYSGWMFSGRCLRVRSMQDIIDSEFLYYYFTQETIKQFIRNIAVGATMPSINTSLLSQVSIKYPSLPEQRTIAATLSCLDKKIELNNKINANLEAQAQAIFKSWFVNFEPLQAGEFVESELGMIPRGWRVRKLGDIARYVGERIPVSHCNTENYISTENMQANKQGVIEATSLPSMPAVSGYEEHDILISNIRPYFKKIWFSDKVGGCSNDVLVFRAKHAVFIGVLYSVLYSDTFFEHATATSKGTKMPRGDKTAIMSYPIVLPAMPESSIYIQQLNIMVLEFQKKIAGLRKENQTLAALRDTLLPQLMSGEIEVSTEDIL